MTNVMDMAALEGRVVTEGHARICRERGHAAHRVNRVERGICPRCGEYTLVNSMGARTLRNLTVATDSYCGEEHPRNEVQVGDAVAHLRGEVADPRMIVTKVERRGNLVRIIGRREGSSRVQISNAHKSAPILIYR